MKILVLNACVREESRTYQLTEYLVDKLKEKSESAECEELNLEHEDIRGLTKETLEFRNQCVEQRDYSAPVFRYAKQFAQADFILLAAPYWDLSFPAMVKAYFEAISVLGLTFVYTENGVPKGLCRAKRFVYITTAGGSMQYADFGWQYVETLAKMMYGISDVSCIRAENLDIAGADVEQIMGAARTDIDLYMTKMKSEDL